MADSLTDINKKYTQTYTNMYEDGIRNRLEEYRNHLGMNQIEFANAIGTTQATYSRYIAKVQKDSKCVSLAIEHLPDLNCNWLFRGIGNMSVQEEWHQAEQTGQMKEAAEHTAIDYPTPTDDWRNTLQVAEGDSIDRIWYNVLLRENAEMKHEIDLLRRMNIELERRAAVAEDRIQNAEVWYRNNIQNKKG